MVILVLSARFFSHLFYLCINLYSGNIRFFCGECGTHLYAYDKEWAQWCYPFASCIDTPLPKMDATTDCYHIMQNSKPDWVPVPKGAKHIFEEYPDCSLEDWHKQHKQFIE